MALVKESWLPQAEALELGERSRCPHDCGPGDTLIIEHSVRGWSAYCFRCDDRGFKGKPPMNLKDRLALREAQERAERDMEFDPRPPQPCDFNVEGWPLAARVWLYSAGLTIEDIKAFGAYHHPPSKRVVLPVLDGDRLVYWQARKVEKVDGPKYLNPKVPRGSVTPRYGQGKVIVLTEDILSAYRVGQATEAWSLLGVVLHPPVLAAIMKDGRPVIVWLDDDKGGWDGAHQVTRTLSLAGVKYHNLVTPKDPKRYSRAEIAQHIQEATMYVT